MSRCLVWKESLNESSELRNAAEELRLSTVSNNSENAFYLDFSDGEFYLRHPNFSKQSLRASYAKNSFVNSLKQAQKEGLLRALGLKTTSTLKVLDATRGLGKDTLRLLFWSKCKVTSVEKNKYLNFIFKTGLENFFSRVKFGGSEISSRLNLLHADALEIVKNASSTSFDVIFLDPMYPEKKSQALASGEMQLFQELLNDEICESATEELIDTAISSGCKRVVLKRPLKAPVIGKVSYSQKGSKTRYDIYLPRS